MADGGVCAERKDNIGTMAASTTRCQVAVESRPFAGGYHSFADQTGDRGKATLTDGTLVLRCGTSDTVLFKAAVRCYAGQGDYQIAAGDLILGGKYSDRTCRLTIHPVDSWIRGFIECPNSDGEPDNVFAHSGAPIGLGAFDLPL